MDVQRPASALVQQVIVITGASAGIGEAVARQIAAPGVILVLAARREGILRTLADLLTAQGAEILVVPTDMGDPESITRLVTTTLDTYGRIDIVINNAGYGQMGPVEMVSDQAVRQQFEINVFGLLALTRQVIPAMRQAGKGRIINLSSVAGHVSMPFSGIYNASKHAVEALSDSLRVEVAPFGIEVILIEPGPVTTEFFQVAAETTKTAVPAVNPYAVVLNDREDISSSIAKMAWTPEQVAVVIERAMTDRHPRPRYTAFTGGTLGLALMQMTPAPVLDRMWAKLFRWPGSPSSTEGGADQTVEKLS